MFNYETQPAPLQANVLPLIGILRSLWYNSNGRVSIITYGTAVAISPRVVLTCAHNIYSQSRRVLCDAAQFIPNVEEGWLGTSKVYRISYKQSFKYKIGSFQIKPTTEQAALLLLDQNIENYAQNIYPTLATIPSQTSRVVLKIVGYPSKKYCSTFNLSSIYASRKELTGSIHSIDKSQSIINHTMVTSVGFSGSPIFAQSPQGTYFICGIHTHRGLSQDYNSGLYFTPQVLAKIKQFVSQLKRDSQLQYSINLIEEQQINKIKCDQLTQANGQVGEDEEEALDLDQSDDEKYDNMSRISCFDDIFQREEQFDEEATIQVQD